MSTAIDKPIDLDQRPYIVHDFWASVQVRDGRPVLVPTDQSGWRATLGKLADQVVKVTLQRARKRHSPEAQAYLWGVVYVDVLAGVREMFLNSPDGCPFADAEDVHKAMKYLRYGLEVVKLPGGETIEREARTHPLNSKQYAEFIDFVRNWAATKGIYTREPGEEVTA